jgi:hypothetical protein
MSAKYKITKKYCWFENGTLIVSMYFINEIPFTFDELPDGHLYDRSITEEADKNPSYGYEDLYRLSDYLISEECHPCLFEMELENPEDMPEEFREDLSS